MCFYAYILRIAHIFAPIPATILALVSFPVKISEDSKYSRRRPVVTSFQPDDRYMKIYIAAYLIGYDVHFPSAFIT